MFMGKKSQKGLDIMGKKIEQTRDIENYIASGPGQIIGYRRVSTLDQSLDRQDLGKCDRIFEEKLSAATDSQRPQLDQMIQYARSGDTVVVYSTDRLARSLRNLQEIVQTLTENGVSIRFLKENLEFAPGAEDPFKKMMLQMLGSFAEFERNLSKQRQAEGIAKAKERGVYGKGRPPSMARETIQRAWEEDPAASMSDLAKKMGVSTSTIGRALRDYPPYQSSPLRRMSVAEKHDYLRHNPPE